jgi:hypothetical protein
MHIFVDMFKVLEAILAFFAALVARDPLSLSELADKPDFISTLLTMLSSLDHERDALALVYSGGDDVMLKKVGVVKSEKTSVRILWAFGHFTPIEFI